MPSEKARQRRLEECNMAAPSHLASAVAIDLWEFGRTAPIPDVIQ
jgi:hypothetical protein